jgi:hypothetical protein
MRKSIVMQVNGVMMVFAGHTLTDVVLVVPTGITAMKRQIDVSEKNVKHIGTVAKGNAAKQSPVLRDVCLVKLRSVMAFTDVGLDGRVISTQDYVNPNFVLLPLAALLVISAMK